MKLSWQTATNCFLVGAISAHVANLVMLSAFPIISGRRQDVEEIVVIGWLFWSLPIAVMVGIGKCFEHYGKIRCATVTYALVAIPAVSVSCVLLCEVFPKLFR